MPRPKSDLKGKTEDIENNIYSFLKKNKDNMYTFIEIYEELFGKTQPTKDWGVQYLLTVNWLEIQDILNNLINQKKVGKYFLEGDFYFFYKQK